MTVRRYGAWTICVPAGQTTWARVAWSTVTIATHRHGRQCVLTPEIITVIQHTVPGRFGSRLVGSLLTTLTLLPADLRDVVHRLVVDLVRLGTGPPAARAAARDVLWNTIKVARREARRRRSEETPASTGAPPARP